MQRAIFFLVAAVICALLAWPADTFASTALGLSVTYVVLALASFLDDRSRSR